MSSPTINTMFGRSDTRSPLLRTTPYGRRRETGFRRRRAWPDAASGFEASPISLTIRDLSNYVAFPIWRRADRGHTRRTQWKHRQASAPDRLRTCRDDHDDHRLLRTLDERRPKTGGDV